jgi:hypothetical protein
MDALRALIHAANTARDKGLAAVPDDATAADLVLFRNAVRVGRSEVRRVPGAKSKQKSGRMLLECPHRKPLDAAPPRMSTAAPSTGHNAIGDNTAGQA